MSFLNIVPAFALTALVLAMVPGQGVAMVLRQTLTGEARGAMASVLGNSSGLIVWGVASSVGLSQVFAHSPLGYNILKYVGVHYLGYLAAGTLFTLRQRSGAFEARAPRYVGASRRFRRWGC
jgi:threonine/homoserine/homoserine lactone efflux protein